MENACAEFVSPLHRGVPGSWVGVLCRQAVEPQASARPSHTDPPTSGCMQSMWVEFEERV